MLKRLKNAGLDSIPGGGGEILVDEVRKKNTTKCNTAQWLEVMETAHRPGLADYGNNDVWTWRDIWRIASSIWTESTSCSKEPKALLPSFPGHSSRTTLR